MDALAVAGPDNGRVATNHPVDVRRTSGKRARNAGSQRATARGERGNTASALPSIVLAVSFDRVQQ